MPSASFRVADRPGCRGRGNTRAIEWINCAELQGPALGHHDHFAVNPATVLHGFALIDVESLRAWCLEGAQHGGRRLHRQRNGEQVDCSDSYSLRSGSSGGFAPLLSVSSSPQPCLLPLELLIRRFTGQYGYNRKIYGQVPTDFSNLQRKNYRKPLLQRYVIRILLM